MKKRMARAHIDSPNVRIVIIISNRLDLDQILDDILNRSREVIHECAERVFVCVPVANLVGTRCHLPAEVFDVCRVRDGQRAYGDDFAAKGKDRRQKMNCRHERVAQKTHMVGSSVAPFINETFAHRSGFAPPFST